MKKKFLILLSVLLIFPCVLAEEWEDFGNLDRAWDGQKTITNKEFDDVVNALEANKKKKEAKQRKKLIKKVGGGGTSLHSELNPDKNFSEIQNLKPDNNGMLINVPVNLLLDGKILEKGFYNLIAQKDENGDLYILFYQSQYFKGKIPAKETNEDFDEETLDFARLIPYNNSFVKIIYGCLDFNAYAFVPFSE